MSKLKFTVIYCKGEEPDYPACELNQHSPTTKGWQSPQFCEYPQELGFALAAPSHITQVQILSHQSKISTKIELFVGEGPSYEDATFRRLGYLSLNSNERSGYQARELKSVYVDTQANFVRLVVHKCFVNQHNLFNQVGIIAVNLLGELSGGGRGAYSSSPGMGYGHVSSSQSVGSHTSDMAGPYTGSRGLVRSTSEQHDIGFDMNYDPETAQKLREIIALKHQAVKMEDFDLAKVYKQQEIYLKSIGSQLAQLEDAKRQAVQLEDYDRAKMLKQEIESLRARVSQGLDSYSMNTPNQAGARSHGHYPPAGPNSARNATPGHYANPGSGGQPGGISAFEGSPVMRASNGAITRDVFRQEVDPPSPLHDGYGSADSSAFKSQKAPVMNSPGNDARNGPPSHREPFPSRHPRKVPTEPDIDSDDGRAQAQPNRSQDKGYAARGPHPLEGVPNCSELPQPDALSGSKAEEVAGIQRIVGDYITACLLSKQWTLREAALMKITMMLPEYSSDSNFQAMLAHLCQIARLGVDDKMVQVFVSTLKFIESLLEICDRKGMRKIGAEFESLVATLLFKLGDGQARTREAAQSSLVRIAKSKSVGPGIVFKNTLAKFSKKQATAWRPLACRLQLLTELITVFGLTAGTSADAIMGFAQENNTFTHSNVEVRDAVRELTVAVHGQIGDEVERFLTNLRPKQLDEYREAFQSGGDSKVEDEEPSPSAQRDVEYSDSRPPDTNRQDDPLEESADSFTCQFCGEYNPQFTEEALDLHYWQACVMLMSCAECSQVIEISCLTDHLLNECDFKDKYVECNISGEAVLREELSKWQRSSLCQEKMNPDEGNRCTLCHEAIGAGEEGWRHHLTSECESNPRRK